MKKFKERLKELRLKRKLLQKELSRELELSEKTISGYESGYREPSIDIIIKICAYFHITAGYLLGLED